MPTSRFEEDGCHLKIVHNTEPKYDPEVLNLVEFPASCHICKCSAASLYLKSKDISERDYSKQLCNLLSMEKSKLYIELDGLTKKAWTRLVALLTSARRLFDQRLTIILFSEKSVKDESLNKIINKEIKYKEISESNSKKSRDVMRSDCSDTEMQRLRSEVSAIKEQHELESKLSQKQIENLKVENEKLSLGQGKAKIEVDNLESSIISMKEQQDDLKEELKEVTAKNKDLSKRHHDVKEKSEETGNINENLNVELKSLKLKLMEVTNEHHSLQVKNDDLQQKFEEISASHKNLELKNQEASKLANEMLQERNSILSKLEHSENRASDLVNALKKKEAECKESLSEKVLVEPLSDRVEDENTSQGSVAILSSMQSKVEGVQALHPLAGPCEIVNRSIEGFSSQNDYLVLKSGAYECNVTVKGPASLLKLPSLSSVKGTGKSKKLAKANAFETVLKTLKKFV